MSKRQKMPSGIPYIIGNEAAERFSYYGMRTILVIFMTKYLVDSSGTLDVMNKEQALVWYHSFSSAVYAFPLLGALISDMFWGKYKTIMSLSVVYCLGHLALAFMDVHVFTQMMEPRTWLALGLALIAVGSGGIKPCVSAHVGDQFRPDQKPLLEKIFSLFYFAINFGATLSSIATPWLLDSHGPAVAFGIPGLLMFIATIFFWIGRTKFVAIPSISEKIAHKKAGIIPSENILIPLFKVLLGVSVVGTAGYFFGATAVIASIAIMLVVLVVVPVAREQAKSQYPYQMEGATEYFKEVFSAKGLKALGGLGALYIFVAVFWCLFDQTGSSWVLQADKMDRMIDLRFGPLQMAWLQFELLPSQIQAINPILVMAYIPLFNFVLYPFMSRYFDVTPLRKIGIGFFVTTFSFAIVAYVEGMIQAGLTPSILWQFWAYVIITSGEILISITALEFSYTQAPNNMKSIIMGIFLLSVTLGNLITAGVNLIIQNDDGSVALSGAAYYWFFTALIFVAGILFIFAARMYKEESYIQEYDGATQV